MSEQVKWKPIIYTKTVQVPLDGLKVNTAEEDTQRVREYVQTFLLGRFAERYVYPISLVLPDQDPITILKSLVSYTSIASSKKRKAYICANVKMYAVILCPGLLFPVGTEELDVTLYDVVRHIKSDLSKTNPNYKRVVLSLRFVVGVEERTSDVLKLMDFDQSKESKGLINAVVAKVASPSKLPDVVLFPLEKSPNQAAMLTTIGKPWSTEGDYVVVKREGKIDDSNMTIVRYGSTFDYWCATMT